MKGILDIENFIPNKLNKNTQIQVLRGIATSAVVLIHLLNIGLLNIPEGNSGHLFYKLSHSLLQFAVPCFVFISSFLVSYSFNNKNINFFKFYSKKIVRIFVPYFLWSMTYILIRTALGQLPWYKLFKPSAWIYWLSYGKAYTHLYFMSVIIQFYIVAPFLVVALKWINKITKKHQFFITCCIAFIPQILIYWINRIYIYQYFSSTATIFVWYWCICIIGIWSGLNSEKLIAIIHKNSIFYSLFSIVGILTYIYYQIALYNHQKISTFYYQMTWYWYVLIISVGGFYLIEKYFKNQNIRDVLMWIGDHSFGIYFAHPLITFVLSKAFSFTNPYLLFLLLIMGYVFIIFTCGLFSVFLKNNKYLWIFVGDKN